MDDLGLLLKASLPIDNIDRVLFDTDDGIVLVWVDMQDRPDVATLAARHGEEEGDCTCTLFSGNHNKRNLILGLRVEMRTPTSTVFHLALKVERYIAQLSLFAQFGKIWIAPETKQRRSGSDKTGKAYEDTLTTLTLFLQIEMLGVRNAELTFVALVDRVCVNHEIKSVASSEACRDEI